MRILFVTNNYTPYSGGVVSSINATVQELRKQGHEITIVTLSFLGKQHDDPSWVKRLWCPIRFAYKTNYMALPWRKQKQLARIVKELKPDIVHVHHPFLLGPAALRVAHQQGIPVLFTYHTVYEAYAHYVPLPQTMVKRLITYCVLSFCRQVDGIIVPSSDIATYLDNAGIKKPIRVLASGLQQIFLPQFQKVTKKCYVEPLRLLIVSRMVKEKNVAAVLRVAAQLLKKNVRFTLTLIGYGPDYDMLRTYAYDELKLPHEVVTFVHKPSKGFIAQAYQQADIFLFSSSTDTQGLVLAEAMAGGTPVIAFDGAGQRDIIVQGENGYIVTDENAMVQKIIDLDADCDLLQQLSLHAHKTAYNYLPDVLARRLVDFYKAVSYQQT